MYFVLTNDKCTFTFSVLSLFVGVLPRRHSVTMSTEVCGEFSGVCCWSGPRSQKSSTAEWTCGSHQTITSQRYTNRGVDDKAVEMLGGWGGGGGGMQMFTNTSDYCLSNVVRLSIISSSLAWSSDNYQCMYSFMFDWGVLYQCKFEVSWIYLSSYIKC